MWPLAAGLFVLVLLLSPAASFPALVAGVLLFHFFPGLALARLLDHKADLFEQAVLGLALSPAAVTAVLYCATYLLRLPFNLALVSAGALFAGLLLFTSLRAGRSLAPAPTLPAGAVFSALLLLTGVIALYFVVRPITMIGPHGIYHTATIHQVLNGIIPPHNTHLFNAPTAYQWPCYLGTAAFTAVTGASPPVAAATLRLGSFVSIFGMGYLMARHLGQGVAGRALSGLFTTLGMNLLGGLQALYTSLGSADLRSALFEGRRHIRHFVIFTPWFVSDELSLRLINLVIKLFHFSFILPGYVSVMVAVFGLLLVLKGEGRKGYVLLGLGTFGALLIHPLLAATLAVPLPLAFLALRFTGGRTGEPPSWKRTLSVIAALVLPALACLPYLVPEMKTSGGHGVTTGFSLRIVLAFLWVYAPLLLIALWGAFRRGWALEQAEWLLWFFALFNVAFLTLQQIKCEWYMLYVTAIPLGLLAADALGRLDERHPSPRIRWAWLLPILVLTLSGPMLWLHFSWLAGTGHQPRYLVGGEEMLRLRNSQSDLAQAYGWIRENTRPTDILVELPRDHSREELAALTGRRVYVGQPSVHTPPAGDPRMVAALAVADTLFDPLAEKQMALASLVGLPHPVFLFVDQRPLKQDFGPLVRELATEPTLTLALDTPTVKIYRLNTGAPS